MKKIVLCYLFLAFFNVSCKTSKTTEKETVKTVVSLPSKGVDQLLFVNYRIYKEPSNGVRAVFINKVLAEGKLKTTLPQIALKEADLQVVLLDGNHKKIGFQNIKNPLSKAVEFVGNDGLLGKKMVTLDSADISIRIQLPPESQLIRLDVMTNSQGAKKELLLTNLNEPNR